MLDVTFKYKKQISNCVNNTIEEFYTLGRKHCEEYKKLTEKHKAKLRAIMDTMEEETSDLSEIEQAKISENLEKFIVSFKKHF